MAIHLSRLLLASRASLKWQRTSYSLASYVSRRYIQEFPEPKIDNKLPQDYVLILPEQLNEQATTNQIIRIPKRGEPEVSFSKLNAESVFKGVSQTICTFEDYLTDVNNVIQPQDNKPVQEFFKDIELNLYPMDTATNILALLINVCGGKYNYVEIYQLLARYFAAREKRFDGSFRDYIKNLSDSDISKLREVDRKMLHIYQLANNRRKDARGYDDKVFDQHKQHLNVDATRFQQNLDGANLLFSHTVDDPDILAVVAPEFDLTKELHHRERTPLRITTDSYHRFMQICPDRFVRQMVWKTYNKRCSPKAFPKFNNINTISGVRIHRRKMADALGFRTHVEYKLTHAMAKSRQEILEVLNFLNKDNIEKLRDRLQELNDYAADNSFEGSQLGLQEYDVDFWIRKYMYEILIGRNEADLKVYFPLDVVMKGVHSFFKKYFGIDITIESSMSDQLWTKEAQMLKVTRNGQYLGSLVYDAYQREDKKLTEPSYGRVRAFSNQFESLPLVFISTSYKYDHGTRQANLSLPDIIDLFYTYGTALQRLLYRYEYYELNVHGAFEIEAKNLLPNLCVAHLLADHRILQSCSDRGGLKPIDTEMATRMIKAITYFKSFNTSKELYKAHLDLEVHTGLDDIKSIIQEIHHIYSPFARDQENYDFCSMQGIFVGPNDGTQFAQLWSKQLANFCLSNLLRTIETDDMASSEVGAIRKVNSQLLDTLFDPEKLNTGEKLSLLFGQSFEPTKSGLGVL